MKRYFLVDPDNPDHPIEIPLEDYEYLMWIRERERENRERGQLRKRTRTEKLVTFVFLLLLVFVSVAKPVFNIGVHKDHVTKSVWVSEMMRQTELIEVEYIFLRGEQVHGVYFSSSDLIIVEQRASDSTFIHEYAHAADRHNYFPWESELKELLWSTYTSNNMNPIIFKGYSPEKITTELFADAILYMETRRSGSYFSSADSFILTKIVKKFMEQRNLEFETQDLVVDYLTPDRVEKISITGAKGLEQLLQDS
ncbi:MAG: hypothetical protein CBC37_00100 [Acidimicrobiaceae bacterium TMED77]|nr:hypothetical protein [Acidimicrobiales bacterium]OUV01530.1 MAG: hypothetical protein CBC37_00100 [Acidimicrobiaceae bacterium TMED77]|tara:strand:+ start:7741 stop:8499 length:759 start_codon:yes stop_codon:yes gene_type:complete